MGDADSPGVVTPSPPLIYAGALAAGLVASTFGYRRQVRRWT